MYKMYNIIILNAVFRFFTHIGFERHMLGSHGLVTASMQASADANKDGGNCPICKQVS